MQGSAVLHKYLAMYAAKLLQEDPAGGTGVGRGLQRTLTLYGKHGAPASQSNFNIYKRCFVGVCMAKNSVKAEAYSIWAQLRDILLQVVTTSSFLLVDFLRKFNSREELRFNYY